MRPRGMRLAFLGAVLAGTLAFGQTDNADLSGGVRDSSGAGVEGVRVTLESDRTGFARTVQTDATGNFRLAALSPGAYRLRAEREGFKTQIVPRLELSVGQSANLDLVLQVSDLREEITVAADTSVVEREKSAQSSHVLQVEIVNLPIDGRSYLDFAALVPGVSDRATLVTERPVQAPTSGLSFSGQDQRANWVSIDGVDNMDDISNSVRATLSQDAIEEFQINRNAFSAVFGRARGGVVNIVSKSGGNQFHGGGFFFLRDESLDARDTFSKRSAQSGDPQFERRQFGATAGGPLKRDRSFFFAGYEGLRRRESLFVTFLDDLGIFQPTPSQQRLLGFLGQTGNPMLAGLSAALIDPQFGLLRTLPTTFPETIRLLEQESGAFPFEENLDTVSAKLDHRFTDANQMALRFSFTDHQNDNTSFGALEGVSNGVRYDISDLAAVFSDLHVFSPATVNDFKFQYARRKLLVATNDPVGPEITIAGVAEFGREFLNPTRYTVDVYEWVDHWTRIFGGHTLKAGADLEFRQRRGEAEVFLGGQFAFGEAIPLALVLDQAAGPGTAQNLAALLAAPTSAGGLGRPDLAPDLAAPITSLQAFNLGLPIIYFQGFGDPSTDIPVSYLGLYFQDEWRAAEGLTLHLGLRYDTSWRAETLNILSSTAPFQFDRRPVNDRLNFSPRLGLAWDPWRDGKTVVRAGYGIYHQNIYGALEVTSQVLSGPISQVFLPLTGFPGIAATSADVWAYMRTTGAGGRETLDHFGIVPGTTPSVILPGDPDAKTPYSHQASLGVERALGRDWAVSASYSFTSGVHLIRSRDFNVRKVGPNQFAIPGLDPRFAQVPVIETSGNSVYHGLAASLRKRFSSRHGFNLAYTLGKAIDDTTDFIIELGPNDHTDLAAERALSSFDQRHRLAVSGVFETGEVQGAGFWNRLWADWTFSPILVWASGKPFNLLNGFDRNGDTHEETDRPLMTDGSQIGRNTGRGPGYFSADFRIARRFPLAREDAGVELVLEAFNVFNNVNYSGVNNVVGDQRLPAAEVQGSPAIAANRPLGFTSAFDPRRLQLAVRVRF